MLRPRDEPDGSAEVGFVHGITPTKELQSGTNWEDFRNQFSAALAKTSPSDAIEASLTLRIPR